MSMLKFLGGPESWARLSGLIMCRTKIKISYIVTDSPLLLAKLAATANDVSYNSKQAVYSCQSAALAYLAQ